MISKSNLLARQALAHAIEAQKVRNIDRIDKTWRVIIYNIALREVYSLIINNHADYYNKVINNVNYYTISSPQEYPRQDFYYAFHLNNYNVLYVNNVLVINKSDGKLYNAIKLDLNSYLNQSSYIYAQYPYNNNFVYVYINDEYRLIPGSSTNCFANTPLEINVYYIKLPELLKLDLSNYANLLCDIPSIYENVLILKISSILEILDNDSNANEKLLSYYYHQSKDDKSDDKNNKLIEGLLNELQRNIIKGGR